MYSANFNYHRPATIDEALGQFDQYEDASFLAGGQTLISAMKNRLAAPQALIDLRGISDLQAVTLMEDKLRIGATTVHSAVASSAVVRDAVPALAALAGSIGDPQVRNMGTIGGSLANNDPSADYPAAALGLGATMVTNLRSIPADDYFDGLFSTALERGEIILAIDFPIALSCGYAKLCSQASRYSVAGVLVARTTSGVRVAVTGAGGDGVFRWKAAEEALEDEFTVEALTGMLPDPDTLIHDLNGDGVYRAHLVTEMTRRAVAHQGEATLG